jgi:hypothetical protein
MELAAMMAILATLLPYLLGGGLLLTGYIWEEHHCNAACKSQQSRADKLQTAADDARKRATDLALLYANTLTKADKDTQDALAQQKATFAALKPQIINLSPLPSIVLSPPAVVVLNGITDAANASPTPSVNNGAGETLSESDFAAEWSAAGEAYSDAVTKLHACINTYQGIRNVQVH